MRRLVSLIIAPVLLIGLAPAQAAPQKQKPVPIPVPNSKQYPLTNPGETRQGTASPAPPMNISVQPDEVARAGGKGSVTIPLIRTDKGRDLRKVRIDVRSGKGTTLRSVSARGWRCAERGARATCTMRTTTLRAGNNPQPLFAVVGVKRSFKARNTKVTATARWKGSAITRSETSTRLRVLRPLRVTLRSAAGPRVGLTTNKTQRYREFNLAARVRGLGGAQADVRWKQLSGPRATFVHKARASGVRDKLSQIVRVPDRARGKQKYRFAMIIDANGQVVRKTITVTTHARRDLGRVPGRNEKLVELAQATRRPDKLRRLQVRVNNGVQIKAKPGFTVRPQRKTRVRVVTNRPVKSIVWFKDDQRIGSGKAVTVKSPAVPHASYVVQARVTLRNGKGLLESTLIRASEPVTNNRQQPTTKDFITFCAVADQAKNTPDADVQLDLGGIYSLTIPGKSITEGKDFRDGKVCKGLGQLNFEKGELKRGTTLVANAITGNINAQDGVNMETAAWLLPDRIKPPGADAPSTVSLVYKDKPVSAPLDDGVWKLPAGSFRVKPFKIGPVDVNGLELIPLPGGWKFDANKTLLTFLNSTEADKSVKDGTLQFSEVANGPADPSQPDIANPSASFTVNTADGQWDSAEVAVANVVLGHTAGGDTMSVSGTGKLSLTGDKDRSVQLGVQCLRNQQVSATCELVQGLLVKDFTFAWSRQGINLLGNAAVRYGTDQSYAFTVSGVYKDSGNWSMAAINATPWDLGASGLTLTDLAGSLGMTPQDSDPTTARLFVQIAGAVKGLDTEQGVNLKEVSGAITNACPQGSKDCTPGAVRVALQATVSAALPGRSDPVTMKAAAALNLKTMLFRFDFGLENVDIGPDKMQVKKATFILTNEDTGSCRPKNSPAPTYQAGVYSLQLLAQASLLGKDVQLGGTVRSDGYCLWSKPGQIESIDTGAAGKTVSQVVAYTNQPGGAELRLPDGEQAILQPKIIQYSGDFNLPRLVDDTFGITGNVRYTATLATDSQSLSFKLTYTPTTPVSLYSTANANLTLSELNFTLAKASKEYTLILGTKGSLFMKGGNGTLDSTTPLMVKAGFNFGGDTQLFLSAGVDTTNGAVENAFGQPGLIVRQLSLSFSMSMPKPAVDISFRGDVTLPDSWVGPIGIKPGTREALSFSLGAANWCFAISIGEQNTDNNRVAVDLANKGFLTASYFNLVVAPRGCTFDPGDGKDQTINPGFAFAFIGKIAGAPLTASVEANWKDGVYIKGTIRIPSIEMFSVRLSGSKPGTPLAIDMDINTKETRYNVAFDAGLAIGVPERNVGAYVAIKGSLVTSDEKFIDFTLSGKGKLAVGPVGMEIDPLELSGHIAKNGADADKTTVSADAKITSSLLGIKIVVAATLRYQHQQLMSLGISAGASLNLIVGAVSGNVQFNYCLGTLSPLRADGTGSRCTIFDKYVDAAPAYRVGFFGNYRILWWSHDYTWTVYDQRGTEGKNPPPPDTDPVVVPGEILPPPKKADVSGKAIELNSDIHWTRKVTFQDQNIYLKTARGAKVQDAPPCDTARLGGKWDASTDNPPATHVNPNASQQACGLSVYLYEQYATSDVQEVLVKCTPVECKAVNGPYADQVIALDKPNGSDAFQGRAALIAGLRSQLGVQPAGTSIDEKSNLTSPDGSTYLDVRDGGVVLIDEVRPDTRTWRLSSKDGKIVALKVADNGLLEAYDADGVRLVAVGTKAPLPPGTNPVYVQMAQGSLQVMQNDQKGEAKLIWGIDSINGCLPRPGFCDEIRGGGA